ncbi:MAG: hypothetical protein ACQERP_08900 [Pseudomonadota bacterium]
MKRWKILHQHLIKCGGTSLNAFLDTKYYANKVHNAEAAQIWRIASRNNYLQRYGTTTELGIELANYRLRLYDCVYGHNPMVWAAPSTFSKVTVLREPIERVLSQIRDWKRLEEHDLGNPNESNNKFLRFCKQASISEILDNHRNSPLGLYHLSNLEAKLLATSYIGLRNPLPQDEDSLLELALEALESYDVIGLTESMPFFYKHLCQHMGWCPPRDIEHRNKTDGGDTKIDSNAIDTLKKMNRVDLALYESVQNRLEKKSASEKYDTDAFEANYASIRTSDIAPVLLGDRTFRFDFNMPVIGNGFHGRDAPNTPEAAVWTGPGNVATLFFPVMPLSSMTLQFGIKGYSDFTLKEEMRWWVDGVEKNYRMVAAGVADCIEIDHKPERNFVRVDIETPVFKNTDDARLRGLSLFWYGYKLSS